MEYPKYKCHKEVSAVKITGVEHGADGSLRLHLAGGFADVVFTHEEIKRKSRPEAGWFLVQYSDGFKSFSPAAAFEDGYTLISDETPVPAALEATSGLNRRRDDLGENIGQGIGDANPPGNVVSLDADDDDDEDEGEKDDELHEVAATSSS